MKLSIIIPALNEADNIVATLVPLQKLRRQGHEVIVADGGSLDDTVSLSTPLADVVIDAPKGRARQMNYAAGIASGDILLFLHADSRLPDNAYALIRRGLKGKHWGRFNVRLSGRHPMLRLVAMMMNLRSCLTGIATGDQGIFVESTVFKHLGGFPNIPLMEDIEFSKRLKSYSLPACITTKLTTSSRRWEQHGIFRTIWLMWRLRVAYFLGIKPDKLVRYYQ